VYRQCTEWAGSYKTTVCITSDSHKCARNHDNAPWLTAPYCGILQAQSKSAIDRTLAARLVFGNVTPYSLIVRSEKTLCSFFKGRSMGNLQWQEQQPPPRTIPTYQITRRHVPVVAFTAIRNIQSHEGHHCKTLAYWNHLAFKKKMSLLHAKWCKPPDGMCIVKQLISILCHSVYSKQSRHNHKMATTVIFTNSVCL